MLGTSLALTNIYDHISSPADIPDLYLWLDSTVETSVILGVGDKVTLWKDLSGHARDLPQPTSTYQPLYTGTIYGKNSIHFSGGQSLALAAFGLDWSGTPFTIITVTALDVTSSGYAGIYTNRPGFDDWVTLGFHPTPATMRMEQGYNSGTITVDGADVRGQGQIRDTVVHDTGILSWYSDDIGMGDIDMLGRDMGNASNPFYLGRWFVDTQGWQGDMGEILIYNKVLTSKELGFLRNYLANKWGVAP